MYVMYCHDPRDPLGSLADQDHDLCALKARCDQHNAVLLAEGGIEQFWIARAGCVIYPPSFVGELNGPDRAEGSPWGAVLHRETVMPGVTYVSTHRHGGYHLTPEVNACIPAEVRRSSGYYEQDVEGALPAYFVPFPEADPADVLVMLETQYPELYARIIRGEV